MRPELQGAVGHCATAMLPPGMAKRAHTSPGSFVVWDTARFWREKCCQWHERERRRWFRPLHLTLHGQEGGHLHHPFLLVLMSAVFWDCFSQSDGKSSEGLGKLCATTAQTSKQLLGSSPEMLYKIEIGEGREMTQGVNAWMQKRGSFAAVLALPSRPPRCSTM